MIFNSLTYAVFLITVLSLYHFLRHRAQNYLLLVASYIFYGWWDVRFLFLIILSTTIDYWSGLIISKGHLTATQRRLPIVVLGVSGVVTLALDHSQVLSGALTGVDVLKLTYVLTGLAVFSAATSAFYRYVVLLQEHRRKKLTLLVSIGQNLTILGFFKYFNFFVDSITSGLQTLGLGTDWQSLNIILPIGVSFFTFQSISYTVEVYKGQVRPAERFMDFSLFVAYFPQLVAGPINRGRDLLPQILGPRTVTADDLNRGVYLIILGLFKKVGIADGVARTVDQIYGSSGVVSWLDVVLGTLLFTIQIYCDFSGYSDIARGSSKLLGINLAVNFNLPYFSTNPQEFWRRWHISLSTWLRDYLYIPLGGSRGRESSVHRNLLLTMILGGLWHGAAWNFVLWGAYQGLLLSAHRTVAKKASSQNSIVEERSLTNYLLILAKGGMFFVLVCYGWLLFRSGSIEQIVHFSAILFSDFGNLELGARLPRPSALFGIALLFLMECFERYSGDPRFYRRTPTVFRGFLVALMVTVILMGLSNEQVQFIYFQF